MTEPFKIFPRPILGKFYPASTFYRAQSYRQENGPGTPWQASSHVVASSAVA